MDADDSARALAPPTTAPAHRVGFSLDVPKTPVSRRTSASSDDSSKSANNVPVRQAPAPRLGSQERVLKNRFMELVLFVNGATSVHAVPLAIVFTLLQMLLLVLLLVVLITDPPGFSTGSSSSQTATFSFVVILVVVTFTYFWSNWFNRRGIRGFFKRHETLYSILPPDAAQWLVKKARLLAIICTISFAVGGLLFPAYYFTLILRDPSTRDFYFGPSAAIEWQLFGYSSLIIGFFGSLWSTAIFFGSAYVENVSMELMRCSFIVVYESMRPIVVNAGNYALIANQIDDVRTRLARASDKKKYEKVLTMLCTPCMPIAGSFVLSRSTGEGVAGFEIAIICIFSVFLLSASVVLLYQMALIASDFAQFRIWTSEQLMKNDVDRTLSLTFRMNLQIQQPYIAYQLLGLPVNYTFVMYFMYFLLYIIIFILLRATGQF